MTTAMTPENDVKRVFVEKEGLIGWLRIDNARRLNAMSLAMWNDLLSGVSTLEADDGIRVIVVAGNGGKAFCAGGDIRRDRHSGFPNSGFPNGLIADS